MKHLALSLLAAALLLSCDDSSSTAPQSQPPGNPSDTLTKPSDSLVALERFRQARIGTWGTDTAIDTTISFSTSPTTPPLEIQGRIQIFFSLVLCNDSSFRIQADDSLYTFLGGKWAPMSQLTDTLLQMDGIWRVVDSSVVLDYRSCSAVDSPFIGNPLTGQPPFSPIACPEPQTIGGPVENGTWRIAMPSPIGEDPVVLSLEKRTP